MDTNTLILLGLGMGIVFGFAVEKSRVFEAGMMVGQMQFRNFTMMKVMLAAVATSMLVIAVMHGAMGESLHLKPLMLYANIFGGILFGAGLVIAGTCPGTVAAQIGAGYSDAWFAVAGGIAGAMTYGYLDPTIKGMLITASQGKLTFFELVGLPYWVAGVIVAGVLALAAYGLEQMRPWRKDMGDDYDGYFPGEPVHSRKTHSDRGHPTPAE